NIGEHAPEREDAFAQTIARDEARRSPPVDRRLLVVTGREDEMKQFALAAALEPGEADNLAGAQFNVAPQRLGDLPGDADEDGRRSRVGFCAQGFCGRGGLAAYEPHE